MYVDFLSGAGGHLVFGMGELGIDQDMASLIALD